MPVQRRVLLVEDDNEIGRLVSMELRDLDCRVDWVPDGVTGLKHFKQEPFDLIILDLMLPGMDGFEVCRRVREYNRFTPILMLTAKAEKRDIILGLELGADDYVTKPFCTPELVARINAIFRRSEAGREDATGQVASWPLCRGPLIVHPSKRKATLSGQPVDLTAKEFDLLLLFVRNPGRTFSRSDLLNEIWGPQFEGHEHTVNTHINRLRSKVEPNPSTPRFIQTVWGVGYRFADIEEMERMS